MGWPSDRRITRFKLGTGQVGQSLGARPPADVQMGVAGRMNGCDRRTQRRAVPSGTTGHRRWTRFSNCTSDTASFGLSLPTTYSAQRRASASGRHSIEPERSITSAIACGARSAASPIPRSAPEAENEHEGTGYP